MSSTFSRLSKQVIPSHYNLTVKTDTENETFTGTVQISLTTKSSSSEIFLNSIDLEIHKASLQDQSEMLATVENSKDGITLLFPHQIPTGDHVLSIDYSGTLNQDMKGYYKTTYTHQEKEIKCAATQFEPADARRAFPCFDEPDLKATFDVTLISLSTQTVISNMNVVSVENDGTHKSTKFATSPKMSTYLLAFVVGEFDYIEESYDNVTVRVFTALSRAEEGRFALNLAVKALPFYSEFFDIPYILPKCDMIALPDFSMGAMENWGLVTYRETALLATESSSTAVKHRVAIVVAHELAHMWFGNLVTMDWWTYLWLNEGFATWMSYLCVDYVFPEYDIWTQFQISQIFVAMSLDSLSSSHPIEVQVGHPSEVEEIFDRISYSKGSSIIGYLYQYLGHDKFRNGLRIYLKKHKFGNTITSDLWTALQESSGIDVAGVMDHWVTLKGFPYLEVSADGDNLTVEQHTCSKGGGDALWQIPYNYVHSESPSMPVSGFLGMKKHVISMGGNEWVKFNYGNNGFYRVKYCGELSKSIIGAVGELQLRDKIGLLGDYLSLAMIGKLSLVEGLELCWKLKGETDYNLWNSIWDIVSTVDSLLQLTDVYPLFQKFVGKLIQSPYEHVGWVPQEGEDSSQSLLRGMIFSVMVRFGDESFHSKCAEMYAGISQGKSVPADLQLSVYRSVIMCGGVDTFHEMAEHYKQCVLSEEKMRILSAMGSSTDPAVLDAGLKFSETESVRSQDYPTLISGLSSLKVNVPTVWSYFKSNYEALSKKLVAFGLISRVVSSVSSYFDTQDSIDDMKEFFDSVDCTTIDRCVKQCIEKADVRKCLFADNFEGICNFLSS